MRGTTDSNCHREGGRAQLGARRPWQSRRLMSPDSQSRNQSAQPPLARPSGLETANGGKGALVVTRSDASGRHGGPKGLLATMWEQYAAASTPQLRRDLIEAYAPLARYVVDRLNVKPGPALGYDDLLSQALVGLIDAVDRFDPGRGIKFETYAYHRIRGAVMDMLRDMDWLPRSVRQRQTDLAAAYERLQESLGHPPSDEQLAQAMGVTLAELDSLAQDLALQAMQSLDEAVSAQSQNLHGWEDAALSDSVADPQATSPQEHVEQQAERDLLSQAIEALPDPQRTVIGLYYHEGLTLKEIGRVLGVTESRACQIHGKAMLRIRAHIAPLLAIPR